MVFNSDVGVLLFGRSRCELYGTASTFAKFAIINYLSFRIYEAFKISISRSFLQTNFNFLMHSLNVNQN